MLQATKLQRVMLMMKKFEMKLGLNTSSRIKYIIHRTFWRKKIPDSIEELKQTYKEFIKR